MRIIKNRNAQSHIVTLPRDGERVTRLRVHTSNTTPSWKRFGDGCNNITFDVCDRWVSLDAYEMSQDSDKRPVTKQVMITLEPAAARALRDLLNASFPD